MTSKMSPKLEPWQEQLLAQLIRHQNPQWRRNKGLWEEYICLVQDTQSLSHPRVKFDKTFLTMERTCTVINWTELKNIIPYCEANSLKMAILLVQQESQWIPTWKFTREIPPKPAKPVKKQTWDPTPCEDTSYLGIPHTEDLI